jgi:hypothetical protein
MLRIISLAFAMLIIVGAVPVQPVLSAPAVVQAPSIALTSGTQQCVWQISQPIRSGDTVVGFAHVGGGGGTAEAYQQSVTDNAGNQYNLTAGVHWAPYPEDIGMWYLTDVQGNPTTFYFNFPAGTTGLGCNLGLVEYSGATTVNAVAGPIATASSPLPSLTILPTTLSLIWALGATNSADDGSDLLSPGYRLLINNQPNYGLAVWGSNSPVQADVLVWSNPYWNATICADGTHTSTGCSTVMIAAAIN